MKITNFKSLLAAALSALALLVSGCVSTPTGGTKAGVPFVPDTVTSRYQRPVEQLVTATRVVLKQNGRLLVDNSVDNSFQAKVNERNVWVKITKVDDKVSQVVVMVRTRLGGDIHLAAELDKQIALNLQAVTP